MTPVLRQLLEPVLTRRVVTEEKAVIQAWEQYTQTLQEKSELISALPSKFGDRRAIISRLAVLLKLELADTSKDEKEGNRVIKDIRSLSHAEKIQRVERLEGCLRYSKTRYEYTHALFVHLYAVLISQAKIANMRR